MVRPLRLAIDYGPEKVANAIRKADDNQQYSVDVVQFYVNKSRPIASQVKIKDTGPTVQKIDLSAYDMLCTGGGLLCRTRAPSIYHPYISTATRLPATAPGKECK